MENVIVNAAQVTPEWLTGVLQENGALPHGNVICVMPGEIQSTFASSVCRLEVNYSEQAEPGAPKRLFLRYPIPRLHPASLTQSSFTKNSSFTL